MTTEEVAFWTKLGEVSPTLMVLGGFFALLVWLNKLGLLEFRDNSEDKWRKQIERDVSDLKAQVAEIRGYIEGSKH